MIGNESTDFYDRVYDLQGKTPAAVLDEDFFLRKPADGKQAAPGLGADYKPLFSADAVPESWKKNRFEVEDLERCSVVVPDLSKIQLGDLVVRFGHGGRQSEIGIVVHIASALPDYRSDQRKFMESVIVLSVSDRLRQVTLGTWATSGNTFGGFTDTPEKCHVRRLVARDSVGKDGPYPSAPWDVCDLTAVGLNLDVRAMKEMDSNAGDSVKERWIPNTGEYLVLNDARLSLTNEAGTKLDIMSVMKGQEEVYVAGAVDRGYDAALKGDAYGNIYVNSNCEFEVAMVKGSGSSAKIHKLGVLMKDPDKPWTYRMDYSESKLYDRDGYNIRRSYSDFTRNRLWIDSDGKVVGSFGGEIEYRLAIRPCKSASARPGDDLLLQLGIRSKDKTSAEPYEYTQTGKIFSKVATMKESDYIAVYDKKMLWRANLYIAETNGQDWNKLHPWNAPPAGGATTDTPKWWSPEWGNNQWNRVYDGSSDFVSMDSLSPGNGGQVVSKIPDTTWYYRYGAENKDSAPTKKIQGAVAYDHQGWDDPFSFGKKLFSQGKFLNQYYTFHGERFQKPAFEWKTTPHADWNMTEDEKKEYIKSCLPVGDTTSDFQTLYNRFVSLRDNASERWSVTTSTAPAGKFENYVHPSKYNDAVAPFTTAKKGTALEHFTPPELAKASQDEYTKQPHALLGFHPYVPGLSDSMMTTYDYPEAEIGRYTAGVDCNGLVQRAHGYLGSTYRAVNDVSYRYDPVYWSGGSIPGSALDRFHSSANANHIVSLGNGSEIYDTTTSDPDDTIQVYDQFHYLVPGDVVWYPGQHIMLINRIDSPSGPDGRFIRDNIGIIESVYSNTYDVFGVVKKRNLKQLKGGVPFVDKPWEIWRQK